MAAPLEEVLGPELMTPAAKEQVIRRLAALPVPASERRYLYGRWARMVGAETSAADAERAAGAPRRTV
jgi:hypothetical protein